MASDSNSSDRELDKLAPTEILSTEAQQKKVYDETLAFDSSASGTNSLSSQGGPARAESTNLDDLPESFGRYRVIKLLGRGGMGSVYLAQDTQLDRPVALKIPRKEADQSGRMMARFEREAKAVALLNHPNICPVFDVGEIDGKHFLAMAYIKGKPLTAFLAKKGQQPERGIASTVYKIAMAIQEAHANGILHRDLKPANIMIDSRGEPIVMDFGLSHRLNDEGESRLTQEGTVIGTPAYMAPEQIDGREPISPATDVYSLGVVLYELLTGKCPFEGTIVSVIGQVLHNDPPSIEKARAELSPALVEICQRAMAKQPADRYQSMKEFATALAGFLRGQTTVVATQPVAVQIPEPDLSSGSLEDLFSSSELQAALASSSLHTLPAPGGNSNQLLKVLIPVTLGILILLIVAAFVFRPAGPEAKLAESNAQSDVQSNTVDDEEEASSVERNSSLPQPASKALSSKDEETNADDDDFFLKSLSSTKSSKSSSSVNDEVASANASVNSTVPEEAKPSVGAEPMPEDDVKSDDSSPDIASPSAEKPEQENAKPAEPTPGPEERNPLSFPAGDGANTPPNTYSPLSLNPQPAGANKPEEELLDKESPEYLDKIFHQADRNHDEFLDPSETPMHIIHRADTNRDHLASLREMQTKFKSMKEKLFKPPTAAELKYLQSEARRAGPGPGGPGGPFGGRPPGPPPGK